MRIAALTAALLGLVFAILMSLRLERSHAPEISIGSDIGQQESRSAERLVDATKAAASASKREPPTNSAGVRRYDSLRDYLEGWWGEEWTGAEERLLAAGLSLEGPFEIGEWEDAKTEIFSQITLQGPVGEGLVDSWIRWNGRVTEDVLAERFGFERPVLDWELSEIDSEVSRRNESIRGLAERLFDAVNDEISKKFASEDFIRVPFATASIDPSGLPRASFVRSGGHLGWTVKVILEHDPQSHLESMRKELRAATGERDAWILLRAQER